MGKATEDLVKEHEAILHVLKILDKVIDTNAARNQKAACVDLLFFLKTFADHCHHGKEENILFGELVRNGISNKGGPIGVMLRDHVQGRQFILRMTQALEMQDTQTFNHAAGQYRDLLRIHINKENMILFKLADQVLDDNKQSALYKRFTQHEETVIGNGIREKLHAIISTWADTFGISA